DVALARLAAHGGAQVAARDVAHVADRRPAVDDRRQPPAQVVADDPRGGLAVVVAVDRRAQYVCGIDDHHLDARAARRRDGLDLTLVLGVAVRQAQPRRKIWLLFDNR